jgi:hypothetical protein
LSRNSILSTHSGKRARTYIVSQRHAGWVALSDMYDDGGLSGWTMERPALKRLLHRFDDGELTCGNIGTIPATIKIANMQRYREGLWQRDLPLMECHKLLILITFTHRG